MKKLTTALLAIAAVAANAQIKEVWQTSQIDPTLATRTMEVAVTPNAHTLVLSIMENYNLRLTRYDGAGGQIWTKQFDVNADLFQPIFMRTDADGAAICAFRTGTGVNTLLKIDADGTQAWKKAVTDFFGLRSFDVDPLGNSILLGNTQGPAGYPVVSKFSKDGEPLGNRPTNFSGFDSNGLAVADNGQIYLTAHDASEGDNLVVALTPNLTVRYSRVWSGSTPLVPAADRNGRFAAVQFNGPNNTMVTVNSFTSAGNFTTFNTTLKAAAAKILVEFDANGRLVVASQVHVNQSFDSIAMDYFTVSDAGSSFVSRSELYNSGVHHKLTGLFMDAFGQAYVSTQRSYDNTWGAIAAFDEQHQFPIWIRDDSVILGYQEDVSGAVGRWGQVAMGTTLGTGRLYEGVTGIRQKGLRNLTINGQSFTGGRTITGTVNFYSNDAMNRAVALTSSTSFATIAPTTTVTAGNSQATMSIDLQPTSVRRAVAIEGAFGGTKRKVVFYIEPPVAASVTLFPTTAKGGKVVNATARLNGAAPTAGITATLSSNKASAPVPASVNFASGQISKAFTISTTPVASVQTATISMTAGGETKTALLTVTP